MNKVKQIWVNLSFLMGSCLIFSSLASAINFPANILTDEQLQAKIELARQVYEAKYQTLEEEVSRLFNINFAEYKKNYEEQMNQLNFKTSIIEKLQDQAEKERQLHQLEKEYRDSELFRYLEADRYLQNEMQKDHLFVGRYLSLLEEVVSAVIAKDPILSYAFHSRESENRLGLILTKVVWESGTFHDVSAVTKPLNLHSVFADKTKIPMLIDITPLAFPSLAFLRSIIIHELNHVYMYKDPVFSDVRRFAGAAVAPANGPFSHYFKSMNPFNPSYQYYLIHEYYSFKTQLIFDDLAGNTPFFRLDDANRENIKQMLKWSYDQLNEENKQFIERHPDPPILKLIERFYSSRGG